MPAEQKPSGDWIVWTPEGIEYLQADEKFRQAWEPADDRGRAIWGRVPKMVLTVAVGRN